MDVLQEIKALLERARKDEKTYQIKDVAEAIERVIREELPRLRHPKKIFSHLEAIRQFAGDRPLGELARIAWDYRAAHPHLRVSTCNRRIAWLRRIARLAYRRWGWLPCEIEIELLPEHNCRQRYLTWPEVERLLAACDHLPTRDAITLAVCTGMRQGELLTLTPAHVRGDCLWLADSKNSEPRLIPILPPMREAVSRLPLPSKARTLHTHFKLACALSGLEDLRFHDLRHTTASLLINAGYSLKVVQEVLGHRSVQAANRYAHLSLETKRAALERVFGG